MSDYTALVRNQTRVRIRDAVAGTHVLAEGTVVAYIDRPTLIVRQDDGTERAWSVDLPREEVTDHAPPIVPAGTELAVTRAPGGRPELLHWEWTALGSTLCGQRPTLWEVAESDRRGGVARCGPCQDIAAILEARNH